MFQSNVLKISKLEVLLSAGQRVSSLRRKKIIIDCDSQSLSQDNSDDLIKLIHDNPFLEGISIIWADSARIKVLEKIILSLLKYFQNNFQKNVNTGIMKFSSIGSSISSSQEDESVCYPSLHSNNNNGQDSLLSPPRLLKSLNLELSIFKVWNTSELQKALKKAFSIQTSDLSISVKLRKEFLFLSDFFEILPKPTIDTLKSFKLNVEQATGTAQQSNDISYVLEYLKQIRLEQPNLTRLGLRMRINKFIMLPGYASMFDEIFRNIFDIEIDMSTPENQKQFLKILRHAIAWKEQDDTEGILNTINQKQLEDQIAPSQESTSNVSWKQLLRMSSSRPSEIGKIISKKDSLGEFNRNTLNQRNSSKEVSSISNNNLKSSMNNSKTFSSDISQNQLVSQFSSVLERNESIEEILPYQQNNLVLPSQQQHQQEDQSDLFLPNSSNRQSSCYSDDSFSEISSASSLSELYSLSRLSLVSSNNQSMVRNSINQDQNNDIYTSNNYLISNNNSSSKASSNCIVQHKPNRCLRLGRVGSISEHLDLNQLQLPLGIHINVLVIKGMLINLKSILQTFPSLHTLEFLHCDFGLIQGSKELHEQKDNTTEKGQQNDTISNPIDFHNYYEPNTNILQLTIKHSARLSSQQEALQTLFIASCQDLKYLKLKNTLFKADTKSTFPRSLKSLKINLEKQAERDIHNVLKMLSNCCRINLNSKNVRKDQQHRLILQQIKNNQGQPQQHSSLRFLQLKLNDSSIDFGKLFQMISKINTLEELRLNFGLNSQYKFAVPYMVSSLKHNPLLSTIHMKLDALSTLDETNQIKQQILFNELFDWKQGQLPYLTQIGLGEFKLEKVTGSLLRKFSKVNEICAFNKLLATYLPLHPSAVVWDLYDQ